MPTPKKKTFNLGQEVFCIFRDYRKPLGIKILKGKVIDKDGAAGVTKQEQVCPSCKKKFMKEPKKGTIDVFQSAISTRSFVHVLFPRKRVGHCNGPGARAKPVHMLRYPNVHATMEEVYEELHRRHQSKIERAEQSLKDFPAKIKQGERARKRDLLRAQGDKKQLHRLIREKKL